MIEFQCCAEVNNVKESWKGKIIYYKISPLITELHVQSRSSLIIIIGTSKYGNFACIPDFNAGCYLSSLDDIFWNTEKLSSIIGIVDGVTAAEAIKCIHDKLLDK